MLTSLLRCRACRLSWFPKGGAAAACPACGGTKLGGTLEPFHVGMALIALAVAGWTAPLILGDRVAVTLPALVQLKEQFKEPAQVERAPSRGSEAHLSSTKVKSTTVKSNKVKKRQKAKKRSKHVQR